MPELTFTNKKEDSFLVEQHRIIIGEIFYSNVSKKYLLQTDSLLSINKMKEIIQFMEKLKIPVEE